ncbi:MAG: methyltransferase domain-containing protein, partial [Gammaproteobacteria bacterium]
PLRDWYRQPLGQLLGAAEQTSLNEYLTNVFGYHLLLVAPPWQTATLDSSRIPHRVTLYECCKPVEDSRILYGCPEALPVVSDSLDALILPHTLELSPDPHQVLREADRCLIPEGYVFILGFNPISAWGLWRLAGTLRKRIPWSLRFFRSSRIKDWLALLGFDTLYTRPLFFRPPLRTRRALQRTEFMEKLQRWNWAGLAGAYLLVARKRVVGITPIRPRWRPHGLMTPGLAEPTRRGYPRGG